MKYSIYILNPFFIYLLPHERQPVLCAHNFIRFDIILLFVFIFGVPCNNCACDETCLDGCLDGCLDDCATGAPDADVNCRGDGIIFYK